MKNYSILPQTEDELLSAFESEDSQTQMWVIDTMQKLRQEVRPAEKKLGKVLKTLGVNCIPQAPFIFYTDSCRYIYFADYYDPKNGLVFEADGPDHFTKNGKKNDAIRDANFLSVGVKTIRVKNSQIDSLTITSKIEEREDNWKPKKSVFYLGVLDDTAMTLADKIIYSQILYRSLWDNNEDTFDKETGEFCPENYGDGIVPIGETVSHRIAECVNLTRCHYYVSIKHLRELGYITEPNLYNERGGIKIMDGIFSKGFFELLAESCMKGYSLIAYSYICNKSAKYGWIDKYHSAIARDLHTSRTYIETILTKLKKERLIMVKEKGSQTYLAPTKKAYLSFTQNWR